MLKLEDSIAGSLRSLLLYNENGSGSELDRISEPSGTRERYRTSRTVRSDEKQYANCIDYGGSTELQISGSRSRTEGGVIFSDRSLSSLA